MRRTARRDPRSDAESAEAFAQRTDEPAAWLVAADAWEVAGNLPRAHVLRSFAADDLPIIEAFRRGVEDGLWLNAWASTMEELGLRTERNITRDTADPAPHEVTAFARRYMARIALLNPRRGARRAIGGPIVQLVREAALADGRRVNAEELGFDLTMQSQGHGVSWTDDHACFHVLIPDIDVYAAMTHVLRGSRRWHFQADLGSGGRSIC